jgi:hypothetical protein
MTMKSMETRLRKAKRYFVAAVLCMPPILLIWLAAVAPWRLGDDLDPAKGWKIAGYGVVLIVFCAVLGLYRTLPGKYEPVQSAIAAIKVGVTSGVVGGVVPAAIVADAVHDPWFFLVALAPSAALGALLPWWLVEHGRRELMGSVDKELIESGELVLLRARGHRRITLSVTRFSVALERRGDDGFHLREELTAVESVSVTKSLNEERRDFTGCGDELTVKPGAVVRIRFTRGEWCFPVDNADDVARMLTERAAHAVARRDEPADEDEDDEYEEYEKYEAAVEWHARRDRRMTLTVSDSVAVYSEHSGTSFYESEDLAEVREVVVTRVGEGQVVDVTGDDDQLTVTAGEALLIRFADDFEWIFPIDKAEEIAALITRRAEHHRAARADETEDEDQPV